MLSTGRKHDEKTHCYVTKCNFKSLVSILNTGNSVDECRVSLPDARETGSLMGTCAVCYRALDKVHMYPKPESGNSVTSQQLLRGKWEPRNKCNILI